MFSPRRGLNGKQQFIQILFIHFPFLHGRVCIGEIMCSVFGMLSVTGASFSIEIYFALTWNVFRFTSNWRRVFKLIKLYYGWEWVGGGGAKKLLAENCLIMQTKHLEKKFQRKTQFDGLMKRKPPWVLRARQDPFFAFRSSFLPIESEIALDSMVNPLNSKCTIPFQELFRAPSLDGFGNQTKELNFSVSLSLALLAPSQQWKINEWTQIES